MTLYTKIYHQRNYHSPKTTKYTYFLNLHPCLRFKLKPMIKSTNKHSIQYKSNNKDMHNAKYLPVIGMEIHIEPTTKSKMFCSCPADHFEKQPNSQTCPVCLGLPGALPVPNQKAIEACLKLGLALNTKINLQSKFDRKNYFYPDLPKAYQISQYDLPFCYNGKFLYQNKNQINEKKATPQKSIHITRVHMEEDTGKLQHENDATLIDFNRSGVPLIEIVTEPELHSPENMTLFLKELVKLIKWLNISNCNMEKGSLRLEANISVTQVPENTNTSTQKLKLPKYKVEIKNVNSFRFIEKAVKYEIKRQTEILQQGQTPKQETRGFDEKKGITFSQRSKEEAQDYRYFPEPDIPPIKLTTNYINQLKKQIPELPLKAESNLIIQHQIRSDYAKQLTQNENLYKKFLQLVNNLPSQLTASQTAKYIINQKLNIINDSPKKIINKILTSAKKYTTSEEQLVKLIDQVVSENPQLVKQYQAGKTQIIGYFIGQISKKTQGQADPKTTRQLLIQKLSQA